MKHFFYYNLITQDCSAHLQHLFFCKGLHLNPFFLQVGHLEHKELDPALCIWTSVPRRMGEEPRGQGLHPLMCQIGTTPRSWSLPTSSHFARAVFLNAVFCSTMFLSTNDHDHQQQKDGININTVSGFRLWLLHMCKVSCLNHRRKSSSSQALSLDGCSESCFCCCSPAKMLKPLAWALPAWWALAQTQETQLLQMWHQNTTRALHCTL